MNIISLQSLPFSLTGKRILIRADLNVPMHANQITSTARIHAIAPTLRWALDQGAHIILASHLGRPLEGKYDANLSLNNIIFYLKETIGYPVTLIQDYLHGFSIKDGALTVLENVRFNRGESSNDKQLAQCYASLCDIFVMDAFASAHRKHASTYGVAQLAPIACAGPLLLSELTTLNRILEEPSRPMVAIVSGAKVSSKLPLLYKLSQVADQIFVGGGIANTFLAAQNYPIGRSLYEPFLIKQARQLINSIPIVLPVDVRVSDDPNEHKRVTVKKIYEVEKNEYILDIGNKTIQQLAYMISEAKTILWNGPLGAFEQPEFSIGSTKIAHAIAQSSAYTVIGGGDTIAMVEQAGVASKIDYISTGGGAFLQYIEGKDLPAINVLQLRAAEFNHTPLSQQLCQY